MFDFGVDTGEITRSDEAPMSTATGWSVPTTPNCHTPLRRAAASRFVGRSKERTRELHTALHAELSVNRVELMSDGTRRPAALLRDVACGLAAHGHERDRPFGLREDRCSVRHR